MGFFNIGINPETSLMNLRLLNHRRDALVLLWLLLALAGVNAIRQLAVAVNGQSAGAIGAGDSPQNAPLRNTNSIRYNSDQGLWPERTVRFDAALLKPGENEMAFAVPGGDLQSLDIWD